LLDLFLYFINLLGIFSDFVRAHNEDTNTETAEEDKDHNHEDRDQTVPGGILQFDL